ncbi:hypothetical protein D3C81_1918590 [compost metagenome]
MGGDFTAVDKLAILVAVAAEHATAGIAGVVLGGIEPLALAVEHAMAVEVTAGLRRERL